MKKTYGSRHGDDAINNEKPVVLITYVEAGMGHIVSAQAISDALKKQYGDKLDIRDRYVLRDSDNDLLIKHEQFMVKSVQNYARMGSGFFQYFAMFLFGPQNTLNFVFNTVFKKKMNALVDVYAKENPDVIVTTHFFTHYCALRYKKTHNPEVKVVSYCPDNNVHGWWDVRADMIYTNNPEATAQAYKLGFKSGCVREAFYPTRETVLQTNGTKEFYRQKFGIPLDKFAVAIADGVYAQGNAKKVCETLMNIDMPVTLCLLAGKNDEIRRYFAELQNKTKPNVTLIPFGFMPNAPELYRACDLFVTKAGPNAILDSVMMETPIIADFCATPIEVKTKDLFVKRLNCGLYIKSPLKIKKQVERFIQLPDELDKFKKSLKFFDKSKNGAAIIADDIMSVINDYESHQNEIYAIEDGVIDKYCQIKFANHNAQMRKAKKLKARLRKNKGLKKYGNMLEAVYDNVR